jgi:hypothetical protein
MYDDDETMADFEKSLPEEDHDTHKFSRHHSEEDDEGDLFLGSNSEEMNDLNFDRER